MDTPGVVDPLGDAGGFLDQSGCLGKRALPTEAPGECYTGLHRREEGLAEPFTRQIAFEQGKIVPEELDRRAIYGEIMIGKALVPFDGVPSRAILLDGTEA